MENTLSLEEGRGFRQRKKQSDPICCPVCGVTIRSSEIEQHYDLEIDRLIKLQLNQKVKKSLINGSNSYHEPLPGCSSNGDNSSGCPWVTFQKVRNNRHSRLKIKTRKRKLDDQPVCPVCNERPAEDINVHVELCLRKNENSDNKTNGTISDDDDESIDIEGESFEEYEWAGQKRIRAASLLEGGYGGTGLGTSISNSNTEDEDEDLNVDGDDTQIYGPAQYTERDVIVSLNNECENTENENIYLRKLVTGHDITTIPSIKVSIGSSSNNTLDNNHHQQHTTNCDESLTHSSNNNSNNNNNNNSNNITGNNTENICSRNPSISSSNSNSNCNQNLNHDNENSHPSSSGQIVESLKIKIREYEKQINNKIKCLICMDEFRNPAVSICCWHVHCEDCWLRTLGVRKLCPQCNMITSPADLRRIYM